MSYVRMLLYHIHITYSWSSGSNLSRATLYEALHSVQFRHNTQPEWIAEHATECKLTFALLVMPKLPTNTGTSELAPPCPKEAAYSMLTGQVPLLAAKMPVKLDISATMNKA